MRILKVNRFDPDLSVLKRAAEIINKGGIVVAPTDTCYGLAGDVFNPRTITKIYAIKQRPDRKPISVIVKDIKMMGKVAEVNDLAKKLAKKYLPGALTLILPRLPEIDHIAINPVHKTIGIRIPNCNVSLKLVELVGRPITTTSANISGRPSGSN